MRRCAPLLLAGLLLAGCVVVGPYESLGGGGDTELDFPDPPPAARSPSDARDVGHLQLVWPQASPLAEDAELRAWIGAMDAQLVLPSDVRIVHTECGVENAYYAPEERTVYLCWELLDRIASVMDDPRLSREEVALGIGSVWLFVLFHETGHALVDVLQLPVTGREEDAVDDLATLLLIDAGAADAAMDAAVFWILTDDGSYSEAKFADEHSLNSQRFYTILCTVYGSDPGEYSALVEEGYLPYERAQRCPREFEKKDAAWSRLLDPWTIPHDGDNAG